MSEPDGVHRRHCNKGENGGCCKYNDDDCPVMREADAVDTFCPMLPEPYEGLLNRAMKDREDFAVFAAGASERGFPAFHHSVLAANHAAAEAEHALRVAIAHLCAGAAKPPMLALLTRPEVGGA